MGGLNVTPVGLDELVLACSSSRPAARQRLTCKQIADFPFVTAQRQTARRMIEDGALLELGVVRKNIVLEFGHAEAIKRAVRSDIGVAFLFRSSINDELSAGTLRMLEVARSLSLPVSLPSRRRFRIDEDKRHAAVLSAVVDPSVVCTPLNHDVASFHFYLRIVH